PDRHHVASHDGAVPDRRLLADLDVADHGARLGEEHAAPDHRVLARERAERRGHQRACRREACSTAANSSSSTASSSSAWGITGDTYCTTPRASITVKKIRSRSGIVNSAYRSGSASASGTSR